MSVDPLIQLLLVLGIEVAVFVCLRLFTRLGIASVAIALMSAMLLYLPLAMLHWPGADMFTLQLTLILTMGYVFALFSRSRRKKPGSGWFHWGPAVIIGFLLFIVLLNAIMIEVSRDGLPAGIARWFGEQSAADTPLTANFPGVVSNNLQKKEAQYNAFLAQQAQQRERGWQVHKGWLTPPMAGKRAVFQVMVQQRDGSPLSGATLKGGFLRASDSRADQVFEMRETTPGTYQVELSLPLPGGWSLDMEIERDGERHQLRAATSVAPAAD